MAEAKPFASLSSGLLARKGGAKPAMRPQSFGQMGIGLEDLGWNDMGHSHRPAPDHHQPEHVPSSIAALTPAPRLHSSEPAPAPVVPPPVVEQQRAIEASFAEPAPQAAPAPAPAPAPAAKVAPLAKAAPVVVAKAARTAPGSGKAKAAFTLRLDPERHLKLRLACALSNRSAQQMVTEALDTFLASVPELGALASQVDATRN